MLSRRTLVNGLALAAGATVVRAGGALAQQSNEAAPPSTMPPTSRFRARRRADHLFLGRDPNVIAVDPSFNDLAQPNASIKRLYAGVLWAEGPPAGANFAHDVPNFLR